MYNLLRRTLLFIIKSAVIFRTVIYISDIQTYKDVVNLLILQKRRIQSDRKSESSFAPSLPKKQNNFYLTIETVP